MQRVKIEAFVISDNDVKAPSAGSRVTFITQAPPGVNEPIPDEGGNLFIYEDAQWLKIEKVQNLGSNTHEITVVPHSNSYAVNIRKNRAMYYVHFINKPE